MRNKKWYAFLWFLVVGILSSLGLWLFLSIITFKTEGGPGALADLTVIVYFVELLLISVLLFVLYKLIPNKVQITEKLIRYVAFSLILLGVGWHYSKIKRIEFLVVDEKKNFLNEISLNLKYYIPLDQSFGSRGNKKIDANKKGILTSFFLKNANYFVEADLKYEKTPFQKTMLRLDKSYQLESYYAVNHSIEIVVTAEQKHEVFRQNYTQLVPKNDQLSIPFLLVHKDAHQLPEFSEIYNNNSLLLSKNPYLVAYGIQNLGKTWQSFKHLDQIQSYLNGDKIQKEYLSDEVFEQALRKLYKEA